MKYPFSINTGINESTVLEGFIFERGNDPTVLCFHGNQKTDSQKDMHLLANALLTKKLSSVTFDFSGFGKSTGKFQDSTLEKRFEEAKDISPFLNPESPLIICATGTNAIVAIKLLKFYPIKTLILFAPNIEHNTETNTTPIHDIFEKLHITQYLTTFTGNVLIIKGKNDTIADKLITNAYFNAFPKAYHKELFVLPNADHNIHTFLKKNPDAFSATLKKIEKVL